MNGQRHSTMDVEDFDWTPPTEAELKVFQAKRERADKISKLMGDYLLKGYKMLGTTCGTCDTILLRDRQQRDYCVACSELATDHAKDDPALSHEAAISQVEEHKHANAANTRDTPSNPSGRINANLSSPSTSHPANQPALRPLTGIMESHGRSSGLHHITRENSHIQGRLPQVTLAPEVGGVVGNSVEAVVQKLAWASRELLSTHSVEASTGLCNLIKSCADAIGALHRLTPPELVE